MSEEDVIQVVVTEAVRPALERWLDSRGAFLFLMPPDAQREDDLPTYGIGIKPEVFRAMRRQQ